MTNRTSACMIALAAGLGLGGCQSTSLFGGSSRLSFHNASETAVNVDVFVRDGMPSSETEGDFVSVWSTQVARGSSADYKLTHVPSWRADHDTTVHVQVRPVTPSWQVASASEYWFELLTHPPLSIVATGAADAMSFSSGSGQIAMVPSSTIDSSEYHFTAVLACDGGVDPIAP